MTPTVITGILVVTAALVVVPLLTEVRRVRNDWTLTSWMVLGTCVVASIPTFIAALLGDKFVTVDPIFHDLHFHSLENGQVAVFFRGLLAIVSVAVLVHGATRRGHRLNRSAVIILVVSFLGAASSLIAGFGNPKTQAILMMIIFAAATVSGRGREAVLPVAVFAVGIGIISSLATLMHYSATVMECSRKCGPLGILYFGIYNNENQLAIALALGIPFIFLAFRGRARTYLMVYVVAMTVITGSRTSAAAALVALIVVLLVRPTFNEAGDRITGRHGGLLTAATLAASLTALVVPFALHSTTALTGRPILWRIGLDDWAKSPLIGQGPLAWAAEESSGAISASAAYSPHNQWVDSLLAVGIVGSILLVAAVIVLWVDGGPGAGYALGVILTPSMVIGATERPFTFYDQSWTAFLLVALLLCVPLKPPNGPLGRRSAGERSSVPDEVGARP